MIACVIPARLNSTRFPEKLLQLACGKTVLQRTYECAARCKRLDEIFVATDSEKIASHVQSFGGQIILTSSSCQNGTERIAEALLKEPRLQKASIVINLQGDHPCTSPATLERIADLLTEDSTADMSTPVRLLKSWDDYRSPHVVKCVFDISGRALYFSRSPIPYSKKECEKPSGFQHIGLYAYRPSLLLKIGSMKDTDLQRLEDLEQLRLLELGYRIKVAVVDDEALGIDTPQDLRKLEELLVWQSNISLSQAESFPRSGKA
jgi:3-deoxy-manno-octulosonate cytidylyltransferase (CMP-KDO synthetase)